MPPVYQCDIKERYFAVPESDIKNLEKARREITKIFEDYNLLFMVGTTSPLWKITHRKYEEVKIKEEK